MKSDNLNSTALDPHMLARVLVMPGAAELFDAFARIPPGALRQSVIQHAQVIAETYAGAPASMQQPDPLLTAARASPPERQLPIEAEKVPAIAETQRKPVKTDDPYVRAVELRLAGIHAQEIATRLNLYRSHVDKAIADAKRAGVIFPSLRLAPNGRPLEKKTFKTNIKELSGQGTAIVQKAALVRGISPDEYLRRKALAVDMAQRGASYDEIVQATGEGQKSISLWLSNARAAGQDVPYISHTAAPLNEDAQAPPTNVIRPTRFYGPFETLAGSAKYQIRQAAARRNLTPDAFLDLQQSIVLNRMAGMSPMEIASMCGEGEVFVKDTIARAKQKGAVFPPVVHNASFRKAVVNA
jgi:transposase